MVRNREHCRVDLFPPSYPAEHFILKILPENRSKLQVYTVMPPRLTSEDRLDRTNANDDDFNDDTHKNQSYKKVARELKKDHKSESNPEGRVLAGPQLVSIPFECEERIRYTVDFHRNRAVEAATGGVHRQYMAVLSVDLVSVEKVMEDARGGINIVESEDDDGGGGGGGGDGDGDGDEDMGDGEEY